MNERLCVHCHEPIQVEGAPCPRCNLAAPALPPAEQLQVQMATGMLRSLAYANAIPVVALVRSWWEAIAERRREAIAEQLIDRIGRELSHSKDIQRDVHYALDRQLVGRIVDRFKKLLESEDIPLLDELFRSAVGAEVRRFLENDRCHELVERAVERSIAKCFEEVAREETMNAREVVVAAVRKQLGDPERYTRDLVDRVTKSVLDDMRRERAR